MFAIVILFCALDAFNVSCFGELFDLIPCGAGFWLAMLGIAGIIDLSKTEDYPDMKHSEILANFLRQYPEYTSRVTKWTPVGENSIHITFENGTEMVFTYIGKNSWNLTKVGRKERRTWLGRLFFQ